MTHRTFAEEIAELDRRYRILQRRTILYSLLAMSIAMLFSLGVVRYFALPIRDAFFIGLISGVVFTQTAVVIVRRLNPLRSDR